MWSYISTLLSAQGAAVRCRSALIGSHKQIRYRQPQTLPGQIRQHIDIQA